MRRVMPSLVRTSASASLSCRLCPFAYQTLACLEILRVNIASFPRSSPQQHRQLLYFAAISRWRFCCSRPQGIRPRWSCKIRCLVKQTARPLVQGSFACRPSFALRLSRGSELAFGRHTGRSGRPLGISCRFSSPLECSRSCYKSMTFCFVFAFLSVCSFGAWWR